MPGVILDSDDARADSVIMSIQTAMKASNKSKSPNMNPLFNKTDLNDCFNISTTCKYKNKYILYPDFYYAQFVNAMVSLSLN